VGEIIALLQYDKLAYPNIFQKAYQKSAFLHLPFGSKNWCWLSPFQKYTCL